MLDLRHLPAVCLLFALALIPTVIHSYSGALAVDGREAGKIAPVLAGYHGTPTARNERWGERQFESHDWIDRRYVSGSSEIGLTVIRSYDAKRLYHHPELAIVRGSPFQGVETRFFSVRPDVPVNVLIPAPGASARAAYVLHYGERFVEKPILFQLRVAGKLLVSRRQPMTLLFASTTRALPPADVETSDLIRVLFAAIDDFVAQGAGLTR
jgi:hypothetical protein